MFRYVLFDLDGTLTDPKEGITKCVQFALAQQGVKEPELNKLEPFIGSPLTDSFMRYYGWSYEQALRGVTDYRQRFAPVGIFENKVYPGIPEMLARLQKAGMRLAVASSKPEVYVRRILEHFALEAYFDVVVGSNLDGTRVEKEEVVEEALKQLGELTDTVNDTDVINGACHIEKDTCAMVGDREFDIQGARKHGLTAVGVAYGYAGKGELETAGADYIAKSVKQLEKYLLGGKKRAAREHGADGEEAAGAVERVPEKSSSAAGEEAMDGAETAGAAESAPRKKSSAAGEKLTAGALTKTWDILFPFLLYYLGYHFCYILLATMLQLLAGAGFSFADMPARNAVLLGNALNACSMLAGAGVLLPLLRKERTTRRGMSGTEAAAALAWNGPGSADRKDARSHADERDKAAVGGARMLRRTGDLCLTIICLSAGAALALNILFALLHITELSAGYGQAVSRQYQIPLAAGMILYGLISPFAEETLFRGLIYNRMKKYFSVPVSIVVSSVFFGAWHGNLVQGLYGTLLGLLIAFVYEKTDSFWTPVLAHGAANIAVFALTYDAGIAAAIGTPINCAIFLIISLTAFLRLREWKEK